MPGIRIEEALLQRAFNSIQKDHCHCGHERKDEGDWLQLIESGQSVLIALEAFPAHTTSPIRILLSQDPQGQIQLRHQRWTITAERRLDDSFEALDVFVQPVAADIFDRVRGVFETNILFQKHVAIVGLGSGGSFIARELCKSGVGQFTLIDHDRIEVGNVCRHECGLSQLGRLKVHAMKEWILDRNPSATVHTHALKVGSQSMRTLMDILQSVDVLICATDNRESRLLINRIGIEHELTILFGAVFRRAYGGQVLRVIPKLSPCYQCFIHTLPTAIDDQEISSEASAAGIAYSDRPVAIEPGLSSDIVPIALQVVKIAMVELLRGSESTLRSLEADLVSPLHIWINRREAGTDYAQLHPLENNISEMSIMRWYGVLLPRNPNCAVCGDYMNHMLKSRGIDPAALNLSDFED